MTQDNGGYAFPLQPASTPDMHHLGMTLRDYFAGQALVGLLAGGCGYRADLLKTEPYRIADIMLEARK